PGRAAAEACASGYGFVSVTLLKAPFCACLAGRMRSGSRRTTRGRSGPSFLTLCIPVPAAGGIASGAAVSQSGSDEDVARLVSRITAARWRIVAACLLIAAACSRVAAARWRKNLSTVVSHHQFGDDGASPVLPSGGGNSFFLILRLTCC